MDIFPWLVASAGLTAGLITLALWMARQVIATRLTKTVEHEFNQKLENLRADIRASEERLKAELRAKETEIAVLRGGALSALANRQAALDKRRLEAVDQLWESYNALMPARGIVTMMSGFNSEAMAKAAEHDPKLRQVFETIGAGFDMKDLLNIRSASKAHPFVSPMVWAVFTAILAILGHGVARWHFAKSGLGVVDLTKDGAIEKLVLAVLPHYAEFMKNGPSVYYHVLEALDALDCWKRFKIC